MGVNRKIIRKKILSKITRRLLYGVLIGLFVMGIGACIFGLRTTEWYEGRIVMGTMLVTFTIFLILYTTLFLIDWSKSRQEAPNPDKVDLNISEIFR